MGGWQFWIDRGGTFTDVVARRPDGALVTHKLLSANPTRYEDAAIESIRHLLGCAPHEALPVERIDAVKMGTTVATNALLERAGERTLLVTTAGLGDALRIGTQARPRLFDLDIVLPNALYDRVVEVDERVLCDGRIETPLNVDAARQSLAAAYDEGYRAVAIALCHGYRHHAHERALADVVRQLGFAQVSVSHELSPLMRLVPRAGTCVADAYLSPVLRRYVDGVAAQLRGVRLLFMQSSGGLTAAATFRGKDSLLSGPAGGVVGMADAGRRAGISRLIGFDMGGTSTDVSHYAGALERASEVNVGGAAIRAPTLDIYTVAAGGGSLLRFDGARMRVGPESAGAHPGPACYGAGGPLAVTDCNVLLGKLRADYFPAVFGADGKQPLDVEATWRKFDELAANISDATGVARTAAQVAEGFLAIAVENMANAIKKISVQRGHDVTAYTLCCFGGAGGQHACLVADRLGIRKVLIHPHAGVLSALGIGLADVRYLADRAVEERLDDKCMQGFDSQWAALCALGREKMLVQGVEEERIEFVKRLFLRYQGSDTALEVIAGNVEQVVSRFEGVHMARFGFVSKEKPLVVESMQVETIGRSPQVAILSDVSGDERHHAPQHPVVMEGKVHSAPFVKRDTMCAGVVLTGPAIVLEDTATTVVEVGWAATRTEVGDLLLERVVPLPERIAVGTDVDPVQLEIFNNLFMSVAEQMGLVLQNTAASVNIKERLDFSCAVFDATGALIANAPHIPVHLGSMGESIKTIIRENPAPQMRPGRVWVMNAPYNGGTHLPDITVVRPVFAEGHSEPAFFVAARGHHADVGGAVPGSCPADSSHVDEEGVLLDNVLLVDQGRFQHERIQALLEGGRYPARNVRQNVADLQAQVAACEKGATELRRAIGHFGLDVVHAYMRHVQDNAEECVRRVVGTLRDCQYTYETDDGAQLSVAIRVDRDARSAVVDFTGTSPTHPGNWNAPSAIAHAAVLYVFRCLVRDDIPLNAGCLKPLTLVLPPDTMVNPRYPAAVVAGNVETSQVVVDALFGALGVVGAAQGTMNNFIWGNERHQYYETICGGAGATANAPGCDAVHTHMTNSRLTDVEVLEWRFPVVLEQFRVRGGSGGRGKHRGGNGVVRRLRFEEPMEVNVISGHRRVPPYGANGGGPGKLGCNRKIGVDGTVQEFGGKVKTTLEKGECFEIETPGGGGFGSEAAS